MTEKQTQQALMKIEMHLALERFSKYYKKATKGIEKIYTNAILSNEFSEVQKQYKRFFGFIKKSKNAQEKWKG